MIIKDNLKLNAIQAAFQNKFPYLKIEFYREPHQVGAGSNVQEQFVGNETIGTIRSIHKDGDLSIHGNLKISSLEQAFAEQYGLFVQIFRKSANLWLQTTKTDHWTLAEANGKGERSVKLTKDRVYPPFSN